MTKSKHTPAPWTTGQASWNEEGDVQYTLHGIKSANAADCKLIEAAPELLEALEGLYSSIKAGKLNLNEHLAKARAAIAKAKGEQ